MTPDPKSVPSDLVGWFRRGGRKPGVAKDDPDFWTKLAAQLAADSDGEGDDSSSGPPPVPAPKP